MCLLVFIVSGLNSFTLFDIFEYYIELKLRCIFSATTASPLLPFLNLFVPFSSRQLFFPLTKHTHFYRMYFHIWITISADAKITIRKRMYTYSIYIVINESIHITIDLTILIFKHLKIFITLNFSSDTLTKSSKIHYRMTTRYRKQQRFCYRTSRWL